MDKDLLAEFECPVCNEYMQPPIRMCETGHSFCDDCFGKVSSCPLCACIRVKTRNYALEKLFEKLKFPCKFQPMGCVDGLKGSEMSEHIVVCDYRNINCPISKCLWNGQISVLEGHIKEKHETFLRYRNKKPINYITNLTNKEFSTEKVHNDFQEIFYLVDEIKFKYMNWSVFHFGKNEETKKFSYKININDKIIVEIPCLPSYLYGTKKKYISVSFPIDALKPYMTEEKEIEYSFEIIKNNSK